MFSDVGRRLVRVTLPVATALAVAAANAPALAQTGPALPFVTVIEGTVSGVREATQLVIRDQSAWLALWDRHKGTTKGPLPTVDFSYDMVLAIFGGATREPLQLKIRRIVQEVDRIEVWYTLAATRPLSDGEGVAPVSPFQIVRLARSTLPVRFVQVKTQQVF